MLIETNGVITEERFQKMTPVQWQFQYAAIMKNKIEYRSRDFKDSVILQNLLAKDIETLAVVMNPKEAEKFINWKAEYRKKTTDLIFNPDQNKKQEMQGNDDINSLNIHDEKAVEAYMNKYYKSAPDVITIPARVINQNRYILPKFSRSKILKESKKCSTKNEPLQENRAEIPDIKIVPKSRKRGKINLPESGGNNGNG